MLIDSRKIWRRAFSTSTFVLNQNARNMENVNGNLNNGGPLVTVAFKTTSNRKNNLQQEADYAALPLSSYIDSKLILADENEEKHFDEIRKLSVKLDFYEKSRLLNFLKKLQGQHFKFNDPDGNQIELTVNSVADVFTLLVNSFKLE